MFSGIVEGVIQCKSAQFQSSLLRIEMQRPPFQMKTGDSIAVNGVCLTVEKFDETTVTFALAPETLRILKITSENYKDQFLGKFFNYEGSLRYGDQVHGHLVTGHVDTIGVVVHKNEIDESCEFEIGYPSEFASFFWKKGSVAINGVSLTINDVSKTTLKVCLIPETLSRTNLGALIVGSSVNLEVDGMARAFKRFIEISGRPE